MMTDMEILQLADKCGVLAISKHEWDGKQFNHADDYLDGDGAALIIFAKQMMAQRPWVELEGEEIRYLWEEATKPDRSTMAMVTSFAKDIEAKLKEKNNG